MQVNLQQAYCTLKLNLGINLISTFIGLIKLNHIHHELPLIAIMRSYTKGALTKGLSMWILNLPINDLLWNLSLQNTIRAGILGPRINFNSIGPNAPDRVPECPG